MRFCSTLSGVVLPALAVLLALGGSEGRAGASTLPEVQWTGVRQEGVNTACCVGAEQWPLGARRQMSGEQRARVGVHPATLSAAVLPPRSRAAATLALAARATAVRLYWCRRRCNGVCDACRRARM